MQFQFLYLGAMLLSPIEETPQEIRSSSVVKWQPAVLFRIMPIDNRYWIPKEAIVFELDEASSSNASQANKLWWT